MKEKEEGEELDRGRIWLVIYAWQYLGQSAGSLEQELLLSGFITGPSWSTCCLKEACYLGQMVLAAEAVPDGVGGGDCLLPALITAGQQVFWEGGSVWYTSIFIIDVQSPSRVQLFVTPWNAAHQASLSLTISRSLPKVMSIASVMSSSHLILWCPFLLLAVFPSIRDSSNQSGVHTRWPNTGVSASVSVLPTSIQGWFPLRLTGLISLLSKGLSGVSAAPQCKGTNFWPSTFFMV